MSTNDEPKPGPALSTHSTMDSRTPDFTTSQGASFRTAISRTPDKKDARDVLDFEIEMLRFTYGRLNEDPMPFRTQHELNVYVESYLLHYRALLEVFLAGHRAPKDDGTPRTGHTKVTDIKLRAPGQWARGHTVDPQALEEIISAARAVAETFDDVSEQLHHCTLMRVTEKVVWPVQKMHAALDAIVLRFEQLAP